MYLSKLQNVMSKSQKVVVQVAKCICPTFEMYLSKCSEWEILEFFDLCVYKKLTDAFSRTSLLCHNFFLVKYNSPPWCFYFHILVISPIVGQELLQSAWAFTWGSSFIGLCWWKRFVQCQLKQQALSTPWPISPLHTFVRHQGFVWPRLIQEVKCCPL